MPTISIGPEFFVKERDNAYADWAQAFWREMLQNSVDAGASLVRCNIRPLGEEDHLRHIEVLDNGCGMSRDTLENTFFMLGATTKSEGTIGGFGRARILTHFSQRRYRIATHHLACDGCGAEYHIYDTFTHIPGCHMAIEVDARNRYGHTIDMEKALRDYLSKCQLPCEVQINGQRWTEWAHRRQVTRELGLGTVHVNKSAQRQQLLLVRVNGTLMFEREIKARAQIILEIDAEKSREALTSNRDGLHHEARQELDRFIEEIAVDPHAALRNRRIDRSTILRGSGATVLYRRRPQVLRSELNRRQQTARLRPLAPGSDGADVIEDAEPLWCPRSVEKVPAYRHFDVALIDETDEIEDTEHRSAVRKAMSFYNPESWKPAERINPDGTQTKWLIGANRAKLLLAWRAICEIALRELMELREIDELRWSSGWVFAECRAMCKKQDGVHYLLLNPVNEKGQMRFKLSPQGFDELFALAAHEAVHVVERYHDEDFTTTLTHLQIRLNSRVQDARKAGRGATKDLLL